MKFDKSENSISADAIEKIRLDLGVNFPQELNDLYLRSNGGVPEPYVYEDDNVDTVVTEFLPISSNSNKRTSADVYKHLVLSKAIVPRHYFPFAVDGGGDYFFVDCSSKGGTVHFYRSECATSNMPLKSLEMGLDEFWLRLKPE